MVAKVQTRIPHRFNSDDFQRAWKALKVRPLNGDPSPERTDEKYCTYYPRHRDYGYRPAYIEKLVRDCSTAAGYTKLTGKPARDKSTGAVIVDPPARRTSRGRPIQASSERPPRHAGQGVATVLRCTCSVAS